MWPNFSIDEAVKCLDSHMARCSQEGGTDTPLTDLDLGEFAVAQVQNSKAFKIVSRSDHSQELVVKVLGLMCAKTLPPFRGTLDTTTAMHRRKLRQHVKLSGGGSTAFDGYETKFHSIVDFFSASVGPNRIEAPELGLFDGHYAVDFHTRYFEERRHAPNVSHVPFDEIVDPHGVLESSRGVDLVHGEHNIVEYCAKTFDEEGKAQYDPLPPQEFSVGDIVEICCTFTLYPYRSDDSPNVRYKLVNGMRSLSLLDDAFSKAMKQARMVKPTRPRKIVMTPPKRKFLSTSRDGSSGQGEGERTQAMDQG